MSDDNTTFERRRVAALLAIFVTIAAVAVFDVVTDWAEGVTAGHLVVEGLVIASAFAGATLVVTRLLEAQREAAASRRANVALVERLAEVRRESERYRSETRELIEGLGAAIDRQLDEWQLTPAEKEVALLLLKGLSHKEIGAARDVSDATVRQQARAIYRKAGVGGRSELAAFFLEDLMLPIDQR